MKMDYFKTYFKKKFKILTEEILPVMSKCGLCDSNCVILKASISLLIKLADYNWLFLSDIGLNFFF